MGWVAPSHRPEETRSVRKLVSAVLSVPKEPVIENCGKKSALATPTLALAATRFSSAWRTSGRRCSRSEGRPAGISAQEWLIDQVQPAFDRPGISAQQNAEVVFRLLRELLIVDDAGLGLLQNDLRLIDIGNGRIAAFELDVVQLQISWSASTVLREYSS